MTIPIDYEKIAAQIHEYYRLQAIKEGWKNDFPMPFAELPEFMKSDNRAAARRIGQVLSLAGLRLVPNKGTPWPLTDQAGILALICAAIAAPIALTASARQGPEWNAGIRWNDGREVQWRATPARGCDGSNIELRLVNNTQIQFDQCVFSTATRLGALGGIINHPFEAIGGSAEYAVKINGFEIGFCRARDQRCLIEI